MEKMYQSLTIFDFQKRFPDDNSCWEYLSELRWKDGFVCPECGNTKYCKGDRVHDRQCTKCNRKVSPTSGTLFHGIKIPMLKAFYMLYYLSTNKQGISSTELSRKLGLRQKTCWLFKQKVMRAMKSSGKFKLGGKVEVDETVVGGQEEGVIGRKNKNKRIIVFAIERKGKGIARVYGKVVANAGYLQLGRFMKDTIKADAQIKTDGWTGYKPLAKDFNNLIQVSSGKKGENFPDLHRIIMGFKGWLRGMHHHAELLQSYVDEFTYRFNRHAMKEGIFDNLLLRMVMNKPCTYEMIIA
jgi:predicted RNA-binding Zn-ribbon protein involved in translation (DUF1610 family)